jgi:serine/threonine protein phosphatase 1
MPFRKRKSQDRTSRVYAIGDVHGRLDLFKRLVRLIKQDNAARERRPTYIVLLGNLIDHGPDSAPLIRYCRTLSAEIERFQILKGDHEAMMATALRTGDGAAIARWLNQGGRATLASWGMPVHLMERTGHPSFPATIRRLIGDDVLSWMENLPLSRQHGNHFFVHAGIQPGVELNEQAEGDLLCAGDAFLRSEADHGAVIVHGHFEYEPGPDFQPNRIGINSAAYRTGRLSAVGIEGEQAWPLMTEPDTLEQERAAVKAKMANLVARLRSNDQGLIG